MVPGGTYDIKIRVQSGIMKVYVDGCFKSQTSVNVREVPDQEITAVSDIDDKWVDGELSNIRYFAIGESCSAVDNTGGSCSCPDGFSGVTCQDAATPSPVEACNPCMNGGVFVESEPAAECSHFSSSQAFQNNQYNVVGIVPIFHEFELSFTFLLNQQNEDSIRREIIFIQDPDNDPRLSNQPRVGMYNTRGVYWLMVNWNQGPAVFTGLDPLDPVFTSSQEIMFQTEMVAGGTYDIKIRVKSKIMKVYINGCLKAQLVVDVIEAVDQVIYAASRDPFNSFAEQFWFDGKLTDIKWIDGELSNIKYFAIGDSCPGFDDSGVFDISDNGSCSCPDGFSGSTCQDATTLAPVDPCNLCMNGGVFVESEPAAECVYFFLAPAFQIDVGAALGSVTTVANFELSFTLFLKQASMEFFPEYYYEYHEDKINYPFDDNNELYDSYKLYEIISIQDPVNVDARQPQVSMFNNGGVYWLHIFWNQGSDLSSQQSMDSGQWQA